MALPRVMVKGSREHRAMRIAWWVGLVLVLVLAAFAYADVGQITIGGNQYNISLIRLNKSIAFAVAILGLQVIVGYTGQIALGQSFFFGLGAYTTAYLVADQHWSYLSTLAVVVPICFVVGVIAGLPALRIKGLYLALVTLGMASVFPSIVKLDSLEGITAGVAGKSTRESKLVAPDWLPLDGIAENLQKLPLVGGYFGDGPLPSRQEDRIWKYMLFLVLAAVCFYLVANLVKSRQGRALRAIRDNETSAAVAGIDLAMTKTTAFGVGSALGGVGGAIYVAELGIASPDDFTQLLAINFIVGLVVGGVGTLEGAAIGGLVLGFIPDWASSTDSLGPVPERWLDGPTGTLILGALLIVLTFFMPGGIVSGWRRVKARLLTVIPVGPDGRPVTPAEPVPEDGTGHQIHQPIGGEE